MINRRSGSVMAVLALAGLLLTGCNMTLGGGSSEPSADPTPSPTASAEATPDPVDLTDNEALVALCGEEAGDAFTYVAILAESDPDSEERATLEEWGVSDPTDDEAVTEATDALEERAGVPCDVPMDDADQAGIENGDDGVFIVPVNDADGVQVLDTTQNPDTPPLGVSFLDSSKRYIIQALSWESVVEAVSEEAAWYAGGLNSYASMSGVSWRDALKFAKVNRMVDGKVAGVNALAIQVMNWKDLTDKEAQDLLIEKLGPEQVEELETAMGEGVTIRDLPIQHLNGGFMNTYNAGTEMFPRMEAFMDNSQQVRISLMTIEFDDDGKPVALDPNHNGAGIFIDCLNFHWQPPQVWWCKENCDKPKPPPVTPPVCINNCVPPSGKDWSLLVGNDGWTPTQTGTFTNTNVSQQQLDSGDTRDNVIDRVVPSDTTSDTTHPDVGGGTTVSPGATEGGDDPAQGTQDDDLVIDDSGGVEGATCVPDPDKGTTCPPE